MQNLKLVNSIFLFSLFASLILLGSASINGTFKNWIGAFFIGALITSLPIILSSFLCKYFIKRTAGAGSYIVFICFIVIVLVGLGMYAYFYFQPSSKAAGLEYILIPLSQLMAIPFAGLIGIIFKNRVVST